MIKKLFSLILALAIVSFIFAPTLVLAGDDDDSHFFGAKDSDLAVSDIDLNPREAAVNIINIVLSFLGLVAVVVILIGGFKWMTAGGNEEKVGSAKKLLISGLIGLIIVLLAWGIATWVIGAVQDDFTGKTW